MQSNIENSAESSTDTSLASHGKTLLLLLAIVVVIGVFLAICHAVGTAEYWAAFLFLLYWSMIEGTETNKLPHCIVGALVGLGLGYLMQQLPHWLGPSGGLVFLGVMLVVIYGQLRRWLPVTINAMTMLFLTASTMTTLQQHGDFPSAFIALLLGIVYFAGLISFGKFMKERAAH